MFTNTLRSSLSFAVLLGALFYSTLAVAKITVVLEVAIVAGVPTLKVVNNGSACDGGAMTSDCIEVPEGDSPFIVFTLPEACGGTAGDPVYKLINLRIAMIKKDWPSHDNPLNPKVAKDFKADPYTGQIDFNSGNNKKTNRKLKFKNRNKHAYTVFYEITAVHCDDDSVEDNLHLDPEIRNKG